MEFALLALLAVLAMRASAPSGAAAPGPSGPLPGKGGAQAGGVDLKTITQIGGGAIGLGVAIAGAVGGGGAAAAGTGGTAAAAGGTAAAGGLSAGPVAVFIVGCAAAIAGVCIGIMQAAQDFEALKNGAFGYMQTHLVTLGSAAAEKQRLKLVESGMPNDKARALGRLAGFAIAVGYNRAAWSYLKLGCARETVLGANTGMLGITPEVRHEIYFVARSYGLPDESGYIYEPTSTPPRPPGFVGTWPPPPPLLDGRQWGQTLEWYMFQGVNTTRAQCLALAGADWTPELEAACDFLGRASRCAFSLHNKLYPGGQAANVLDTEQLVRIYARLGMIGLPHLTAATKMSAGYPTGIYGAGAETPVVDSSRQCVRQFTGPFAWYFNESIEFGVVPVRVFA